MGHGTKTGMKSSRKNTMGNDVPLTAREGDPSNSATLHRTGFGFRFDRSQQATAGSDENAHANVSGSPRQEERRRMSFDESKPVSTKTGNNRRLSTRDHSHNQSTSASLGALPPLLGQPQRRMSLGGGHPALPPFSTISTPDSRTKRSSSAVNQASSCKRSRNCLSNHDPAPAAARCSRPPFAHRGPEGGLFSSSGLDSFHSAHVSVAKDAIQAYPSNSSKSSLCAHYEQSPAPRQLQDDTYRRNVPINDENASPSSSLPPFSGASPRSFAQLDAIRDAVRAYTLLPKSERFSDCEPVRAIHDLTGYVLTSHMSSSPETPRGESAAQGLLGSPSVTTRAYKADVLQKLGGDDIFRSLDACKLRDANVALQGTQCRPEKDRGFYRYVHVPTGTEITSLAYEERYIAVLNEACARKWRHWETYFEILKMHDDQTRRHGQAVALPLSSAPQESTCSESTAATKPTTSTPARLLPLPSRDEASSDPEIAEAERELWDKIDAALEEYSHKVLMIQENRLGPLEC